MPMFDAARRHSRLLMLAIMSSAMSLINAADTIHVSQPGVGYNYYDFSYTFIGFSQQNGRGAYNFFDSQSNMTSWAETVPTGGVQFHDRDGAVYRQQIPDYLGGAFILNESGNIVNYSFRNYSGGTDLFDHNGNPTATSTWHDHVASMTEQE
jgi:hypothetical protein